MLIYALSMLLVLGISSTDIFISSLPEIARQFHVTNDVATLLLSAGTAGIAIGALMAAMFSDRFGRRKTLLYSNGVYIVFSFLIGYLDNIWIMIVLRFLQMGFVSLNYVVTRQIIKDKFAIREQVSANGIMASGTVLSPALAPTAGAYIALWFGWRYCFYFSALFGTLLWLYFYFRYQETLAPEKQLKSLPSPLQFVRRYASLFKTREFVGFVLQYGFGYACFFAFISISSFLYINVLKVSPTTYTLVYLLMAGAYLAGNSINGVMNRREMPINRIIFNGIIVTLAGALLMLGNFLFTTRMEILIVLTIAIFIMRTGLGVMNAPVQIRLMNVYQDKSGESVGMLFFVQFVFSSLSCTWVSSFANELHALIVVSGVLSVLMLPAYWLVGKKS